MGLNKYNTTVNKNMTNYIYQGYKWREPWRAGMTTSNVLRAMTKSWRSLRCD